MKPLILLILCGLLAVSASGAAAQTIGPTPTDYPPGFNTPTPFPTDTPECGQQGSFCTIATWNYLGQQTLTAFPTNTPRPTQFPTSTLAGQDYPIMGFDQVLSPTPIPSGTPITIGAEVEIPSGPIYNGLATVENSLSSAPENISSYYVPNQQGAQLFSYLKWMFSGSIGDEIIGPFGPFIGRIAAMVGIEIALAGVYFAIFISRFVLQFVQWIITLVLKFVPFLG